MQVFQNLPVLRVGQNSVGMQGLLHGQTLVVEKGFRALGGGGRHAFVPTLRADVGRPAGQPGFVQDGGQWHSGPLAAGQNHPFLSARGAWPFVLEVFKVSGVAAGALHDRPNRTRGEPAHVIVRQAERLLHLAVHGERPVAGGYRIGHPEVLHHVVQFRRRDQTFQLHHRRSHPFRLAIGPQQRNRLNFPVRPPVPGIAVVRRFGGRSAVHLQKIRARGVAVLGLGLVLLGSHASGASW